jgi:hypothetical protein
VSSIDSAVKEHIISSSVFKGTSKTLQNELLEVCHEKIKEELNETKFVALMADETSDVSEHLQMVVQGVSLTIGPNVFLITFKVIDVI